MLGRALHRGASKAGQSVPGLAPPHAAQLGQALVAALPWASSAAAPSTKAAAMVLSAVFAFSDPTMPLGCSHGGLGASREQPGWWRGGLVA